jgi:hypothetical protein
MADIEQGKPEAQTVEYMESTESKEEMQMVQVAEDVQTNIRRKVQHLDCVPSMNPAY